MKKSKIINPDSEIYITKASEEECRKFLTYARMDEITFDRPWGWYIN